MKVLYPWQRLAVIVLVLALVGGWLWFGAPEASAHEGREVGEYEIVFGWQVEPAYAGVYNGAEFTITHHETDEPLEGAEGTLELTVRFGNQSKTLDLQPAWGEPGRYIAQLTPTRPGDYAFELTGTLGEGDEVVEVEETFDSADGEFSSIEPAGDILFPDAKLDLVTLQSQIDALKKEIQALKAAQ